jgi:hypothetical protein
MGTTMMDIGMKMSLFLTAPIVAAGGAAFKMASDYNESLNKVQVAFKANSKEVEAWSKTTLKAYGIANKSALEMSSLFGDMATGMGLSTAQAAKMSMGLTGLAGDLASFKNVGIEQAQTALAGIFTGETESLKRLGIVMTEINVQEYAYTLGIQKKVAEMSQAEKVQLRYNYILSVTKNSQGDFMRTQEGAANQMRIFGESVKEVGVTFGQIILPTITKVINKLNELLQWIGSLTEGQKKWVIGIALVTAAIGPLLVGLGWMMTSVIPGLLVIGGKLIVMFQTLSTVMIANPITAIGIALATLAAYILIFNGNVKTATTSQDTWNKYLEKGKELMTSTTDIETRGRSLSQMNQDQLRAYKNDVENEIKSRQNLEIAIDSQLKERLAKDKNYLTQKKILEDARAKGVMTSAASAASRYTEDIENSTKADLKANQDKLQILQKHLKQVNELIKPEKTVFIPDANILNAIDEINKKVKEGEIALQTLSKVFGREISTTGVQFNVAEDKIKMYAQAIQNLAALGESGLPTLKKYVEELNKLQSLNSEIMVGKGGQKAVSKLPSVQQPGLMDVQSSITRNNQAIVGVKATGGGKWDKFQDTMQKVSDQTQAYSQMANGFVQSYMQLVNSQTQGALNMVDSVAKAQHKSNEWVVKQKEKINAEAARKEKAIAIAQAMINIAVGITKAIASKGIFGVIEGIAIAAAGATQIAVIQGVKMATGGVIPSGYANDTYPALLSSGETVVPPGKLGDIGGRQRAFKPLKFKIERGAIVAMLEEDITYQHSY